MQWIISDEFKTDLKKLVSLLTNRPDLEWVYQLIDNYTIESSRREPLAKANRATSNATLDFNPTEVLADILQPEFMLELDLNDDVKLLKEGIEDLLLSNFGIPRVSLPNLRHYDNRTTISSDLVLSDFNRELKKQGFSLANIESEDDYYWIIVFPSSYYSQIEQLIRQLGSQLR